MVGGVIAPVQQTQFAKATSGTIRLKLLKIGAVVRTSVRRITFAMASSYPYKPTSRSPIPTGQCRGALTKQQSPAVIFDPPFATPSLRPPGLVMVATLHRHKRSV